MSITNSGKRYLMIAGRILILLIVVLGALQSGTPASYIDPYGFLFILVGGVALLMISFPGAEIWRALRNAAGGSGDDAEVRNSARFWEAAGRGFWILGGLSSVLGMIIGFVGLRTVSVAGISAIVPILIRPLLSTFYGSLLAVICFVPCWKLLGLPSAANQGRNKPPVSWGRPGWRFGTVFGYVLFLGTLVYTSHVLLNLSELWTVYRPSLLVVLGGTLALILFIGGTNTRLTPSAAFACMGLLGSLMGFIQMLIGMTDPGPRGIGHVAGAVAFVLFSCFTALLGMAVVGAPLEDRAITLGRIDAPSAFSRVSWYVFPLLSLIFLIVVFINIIIPLPGPAH
jgi:flagellar motor component MotA